VNHSATAQEALQRATQSASTANYAAIFSGFAEKGIPADQVEPRVNVLTFDAWKALGRHVKKGEHGVRVCTWIPMTKKDDSGEAKPIGMKPRSTTVFHVSQTEADANGAKVEAQPNPTPAPKPTMMNKQPAGGWTEADKVPAKYRTAPTDYFSTEFTKL
jgi:antirestriction protein ArdC